MRLNKYLLNEVRKNIPALLSYGIATLTPSLVNTQFTIGCLSPWNHLLNFLYYGFQSL